MCQRKLMQKSSLHRKVAFLASHILYLRSCECYVAASLSKQTISSLKKQYHSIGIPDSVEKLGAVVDPT